MMVQLGVLLAVTLAAAVTDVRTRKIPNALTACAAVAVIALHAPDGIAAVGAAIGITVLAFLAGSVAFSAGWLGGGDVKLIAACCGIVGAAAAPWLILDILVAGAVVVLVSASARGRLFALVRSTAAVAARGAPVERHTVPYAVAIAAGSIVFALSTVSPALRVPI